MSKCHDSDYSTMEKQPTWVTPGNIPFVQSYILQFQRAPNRAYSDWEVAVFQQPQQKLEQLLQSEVGPHR